VQKLWKDFVYVKERKKKLGAEQDSIDLLSMSILVAADATALVRSYYANMYFKYW
jgi:hypothetical protein